MLLNVRTVFTLLKSSLKIEDYIITAKEYGYKHVGIADVNVLYGVYTFYQHAIKNGLKPLIGMTLEIEGVVDLNQKYSLLLYAKNLNAYHHLIKISRLVNQPNYSAKKVWDYIENEAEDLVLITLGKQSELEQALIHDRCDLTEVILKRWIDLFGQENIYLGLAVYPYNALEVQIVRQFAKKYNLTIVANQELNSLKDHPAFSLKVLEAIDNNETVDRSLMGMQSGNYLYMQEDLIALYKANDLSECISNTEELIEQLHVVFPENNQLLPKFNTNSNLSSDEFLEALTFEQLEKLYLNDDETYRQRLAYELNTIRQMGFSDYFLIVWEIVSYCHENDIRIGPGRGSAAGSLVSYLLKITSLDPIKYDLLFERFLNPERFNMPDIDIDIIDSKRDRVLMFLAEKYGYNQVAQISTIGTFGAKSAIRDVLRVFGYDSRVLKQWSQLIPNELNLNLQKAYDDSHQFRQFVQQSPENQQVFDIAKTIEGSPRHISTHAAAVIISDFEIDKLVPVIDRQDQLLLTQFTMYDIEDIGLLKMDFLGLRNLHILEEIIQQVKVNDPDFDIESIPLDDASVFEIFSGGRTNGVFQFESSGMKNVLRQLKPDTFEDIVAVNALFRPGPMKQIDHFIKRKHGQESFDYIHTMLEPILSKTYGIIVYQEQVMQVCQTMAGFSLGEADILRRAMGKKQVDIMTKKRAAFIAGSIERGVTRELAEQTYAYIYEFASYGFNRSHAVVYSYLAYQLAYLKVHYPAAFYMSILNTGKADLSYLHEARQVIGKIYGIDINQSQAGFSIVHQQLQLGFESIKQMSRDWINVLLSERHHGGNFKDFIQFLQRIPSKYLQAKYIEPLIYTGAFDNLGYNRQTLILNLDNLIKSVQFSGGSISLFGELEPKINWHEEYSFLEMVNIEKEWLGFSTLGHPIDNYADWFKDGVYIPIDQLSAKKKKERIKTIGLIESIRTIQTKNNEPMAFVELSNEIQSIDLVVFPNIWKQTNYLLRENNIVQVDGLVDTNKNNERTIIVNAIDSMQNREKGQINQSYSTCYIRLSPANDHVSQIDFIKQLATENPGPCRIIVSLGQGNHWELSAHFKISYSFKVQEKLKQFLGYKNVIYK